MGLPKLNVRGRVHGKPVVHVRIALDDMTVENGALMVIPGSHKGKTWDHHQDGLFVGAIADPTFRPDGAVSVTVKAGGITLHHVRMQHGSKPNSSDLPRRMFFISFCATDAWPLAPTGDSIEDMDKRVVRGEPTLEPRMEDLPVRLSLPRVEGGSIYEQQEKLRNALLSRSSS